MALPGGLPLLVAAALGAADGGVRAQPAVSLEEMVATRTLGHFALSEDGKRVAFTVAGFYFGFPVVPRFGEDNNVRAVSLDTGEIVQVTTGPVPKTRPRFSPDGAHVAFESEDDVWVAHVGTGTTRRVTTDGADDGDAAWSPDGRRLVFVSNRGGRRDLWIASAEGERHGLRRLTESAGTESDPQWSPDGRHVTFTARQPDDHYYARGLYRVSAEGGEPQRLTPKDSTDDAALRWSPDGRRIAFVSDRSGYARVWVAAPDGSDAREMETGAFDATSPHWLVEPHWSADGRAILVSVNREGSYDLARIDVETGRTVLVRGGGGQHHAVGFAADGAIVYAHETPSAPPDLFVQARGQRARRLTHSAHAAYRPEHFAERRRITVRSADGFASHGSLLLPRNHRGQRLPAIVNLHPNSYGQFFDHWSPFFDQLAMSGYAVLNLDQRGSSGYGRAYRDAAIGAWGTGTLDDVKAAASWLKVQPFVDPARVGVMGLSFGGYLTLLALVQEPGLFAAGVDLMGVADRRGAFAGRNFAFHVGRSEAEAPEVYARLSPITQVESLRAPLLVLHSDGDRNVPPQQTYNLIDELRRRGKTFEAHVYPGEAHGLAEPAHQLDSYRRILAFFDRHLKGPGPKKEETRP
jgi:dipeptidyl aminopeptidase/acylaminoacyl peptidase